jgi:hypothetical protein
VLHLEGEDDFIADEGPTDAAGLVEALEERGLDVDEFVRQLRSEKMLMFARLADQIEATRKREGWTVHIGGKEAQARRHRRPTRP